MDFQTSVIETIKSRKSRRNYVNTPLQPDVIEQIKHLLEQHNKGLFGNKVEFYFLEKDLIAGQKKLKLGTYGFISGAKYFIVGETELKPKVFEDFGYLMEKIILHLTEMNLGTCWLGGTFSRKMFALAADTNKDRIIPAVTPVGYISETKTIRERLIRFGAGADNRKPWSELFFDGDLVTPLTPERADLYNIPLEMIRIAPSASNRQPWRILRTQNGFDFLLKRTSGYSNFVKGIDLQKIDIGIAIAHFDLARRELNLNGQWHTENTQTQPHMEYIASYRIL
jgi:nitroreductase